MVQRASEGKFAREAIAYPVMKKKAYITTLRLSPSASVLPVIMPLAKP